MQSKIPVQIKIIHERHAMSEMGQKAKYSLGVDVFRFTPESGLKSDITACLFRADFVAKVR
jgi:hypothetical protein